MNMEICKWLSMARMDIKNQGQDENDVKIELKQGRTPGIWKAPWLSGRGGSGYMFETQDRNLMLEIECVGKGNLLLRLMGIDRHPTRGKKLPLWVDFTRLKINGEEVLNEIKSVWHDAPYDYKVNVNDGERLSIELSWTFHRYKENELLELLSMLGQEDNNIEEKQIRWHNIKGILPIVHIAKQWAYIYEDDMRDLSQLIEKFDDGYHSVSIVDRKGKFLQIVNKYQFIDDFPKSNYRTMGNLYVEDEDNEELLKWKLADLFLGTPRREIPIIKKGKIKALGRCTHYFDMDECWDSIKAYKFDWNWIDESVAKEFFLNRRRILISSEYGFLKGFRERFSEWLDIEVYHDDILSKCSAGEYDFIIYGTRVFRRFPIEQIEAYLLYYMLLFETVRRWLSRRGVCIHFFSTDYEVPEIDSKLDRMGEFIGGTLGFVREGEVPYYVLDGNTYDAVVGKGNIQPNYHSGRRCVAEAKSITGNGIYFYGPCTAVGYSTYSPDKTIESYLQQRLNEEGADYHVINCATEGLMGYATGINWLYRLMDTPLRFGDVVVVIHDLERLFGKFSRWISVNRHSLLEPFVAEENVKKKCFSGPALGHLNVLGNKIAANYIHKVIKGDLKNNNHEEKNVSFFSTLPLSVKENSRLGEWLKKLPINLSNGSKDVGAIVMKADPITRGHIYLIQEALKRCDLLYVFLISDGKHFLREDFKRKFWEGYVKNRKLIVTHLGGCMRQSFLFKPKVFCTTDVPRRFDPAADTYTFARYIAPRLNIKKRFVSEEPFDIIKHRYNILKHEMLLEEGIAWVEIPRMKLEDGRDIVTAEVRALWEKEGWKACKDYLPMEEISILEQNG